MDSMELVTPVNASVFGFLSLFGYFNVRVLAFVRVFDCSGCSVDFVEKMWESLWGKRWENEEKLCGKEWIGRFLDCFCGIIKFFTSRVEKFCGWIYTCNYLCKGGVLHIFHIDYYYNY